MYVFERVINLVNQEGDVLAVASRQLGAGPFSLVLDDGPFPTGVDESASLLIFENGLWLGEWLIDAENAQLWDPTPDWAAARIQHDLSWASSHIAALLEEHAPSDSFARLVLDPLSTSTLPARIMQTIEQNLPLLYSGIHSFDIGAAAKAAKSLAGLGPGLTPAGDDLLLGIMHGLWATRADATGLITAIAAAATPRTHALSAAWLTAAAAGEAAEPWHALISALAAADKAALRSAVLHILPTGHTSGADSLAGFLAVLQIQAHAGA
jgi:hypothetical protein